MPRMGLLTAMVLAIAASPSVFAAPGCPFCPPTQPTFSEQLSDSDVACLVKHLDLALGRDGERAPFVKKKLALFLQRQGQFSHFIIVLLFEIGQAVEQPLEHSVARLFCGIPIKFNGLLFCFCCHPNGIGKGDILFAHFGSFLPNIVCFGHNDPPLYVHEMKDVMLLLQQSERVISMIWGKGVPVMRTRVGFPQLVKT